MGRYWKVSYGSLLTAALCCASASAQGDVKELQIDWNKVITTSKSTPTLQVVVNPGLLAGSNIHDSSFAALHDLGADYVRYVPWLPYPRMAVAELEPPKDGKTSWDFAHIDPMLDDFMKATEGHSVILNFSTLPAWLFKTAAPVTYPADPNQPYWDYTQGNEPRDPSMKEFGEYYSRLLSWYIKGGFKDEFGKWHASGHHYKIAYWELLNEIEAEHHWTPEQYTKFFDVVSAAMLKIDPNLRFMALALADPSHHPEMFEYFLNPAHHSGGAPVDFISYHFYATPPKQEGLDNYQYSFFNQEEGFLNTVRYAEQIRKRLSPATKTDLDELGVILDDDKPGAKEMLEPAGYWNMAGALYADLYVQLTRMGIDVVGESQLVGYPSQYPSVSLINYVTGSPNARFQVLKLLKDHYGPGDRLVETRETNGDLSVQAFEGGHGKSLLVINKRLAGATLNLPADFKAMHIEYVAPSTEDKAPVKGSISGSQLKLEANEVAVITE
jgi:hypothetical protein